MKISKLNISKNDKTYTYQVGVNGIESIKQVDNNETYSVYEIVANGKKSNVKFSGCMEAAFYTK